MVRNSRDEFFASLARSGEQRVSQSQAPTQAQIAPVDKQNELATSSRHSSSMLASELLKLLPEFQQQNAPRTIQSARPQPEAMGPLLTNRQEEARRQQIAEQVDQLLEEVDAEIQKQEPRDQAPQIVRRAEAYFQRQDLEAQQVDEAQALRPTQPEQQTHQELAQSQSQAQANRPQEAQSSHRTLFQQQHQFNIQTASDIHHENQIARIIQVCSPTPTRRQAESMIRHQRIMFKQVSSWTPKELQSRRLTLMNIASFWQVLAAIEAIPNDILPRYQHVPFNLRGRVDPTDPRTWRGRLLRRLQDLAELTQGQPESMATLLQQSVRWRRDQRLGDDCLTVWDVEELLRDVRKRRRTGADQSGDGENGHNIFSESERSSSDDEDNDQGGAGALRIIHENKVTPKNGGPSFVAPIGGYGLKASFDTPSDPNDNDGQENRTQNLEMNHSLDPIAAARADRLREQHESLGAQFILALHANQPASYNPLSSSSDSFQSSDKGRTGSQASAVSLTSDCAQPILEQDNNNNHIDTENENEEDANHSTSSPHVHTQTPVVSTRYPTNSDLYAPPLPKAVAAVRALELTNAQANLNGIQAAHGGQAIEDNSHTALVNGGSTTMSSTASVEPEETDDLRSTIANPDTHPKQERRRRHDVRDPPLGVESTPATENDTESDDEGSTQSPAETTPTRPNESETRNEPNKSGSRKRRRAQSWGSRAFKPTPAKKRKTEKPKSPTHASRAGARVRISSGPGTTTSRDGTMIAARGESDAAGGVEPDSEHDGSQDEDANLSIKDENADSDEKNDDIEDENESERSPSSSSSPSSFSSSFPEHNVKRGNTPRDRGERKYEEHDDEHHSNNGTNSEHSSDLDASDSSNDEDFFPSSSDSSSSDEGDDESDDGSLPSIATDSDHQSYDFTPSPSPSGHQQEEENAYDEIQADEDAFQQFMQEQYGDGIADFLQGIGRLDEHQAEVKLEHVEENAESCDFCQAHGVRFSPNVKVIEPKLMPTPSIVRSLKNPYNDTRNIFVADIRTHELSERPIVRSGNLDYNRVRPGSGSSRLRNLDKTRAISGSSRVLKVSSRIRKPSVHDDGNYPGKYATRVIKLRPGRSICVQVAPKM